MFIHRRNACRFAALIIGVTIGIAATVPGRPALIGGRMVWVEVAATATARSRGLQFREELPEWRGMLFVFNRDTRPSFWMKNTPLPLSIAFLDKRKVIIDIQDMEPLRTDRRYEPPAPVRFALEMRQGWFGEHGVVAGDRVWFW